MWRRMLKYTVIALVLLLVAIQFVQPERTNPPVDPSSTFEAVAKPGPEVASLLRRACHDCHSHNTVWPWYAYVAPVSWLVVDDVKTARRNLNFSQWNLLGPEMSRTRLREACQEVREGAMPLWNYRLMHPEARLTAEDKKTICGAGGQMP
jgi:hypothetical protein